MATCPKCRRHFRTLEDEEGMHECPRCGYAPWHDEPEYETCKTCDGAGQLESLEYTDNFYDCPDCGGEGAIERERED